MNNSSKIRRIVIKESYSLTQCPRSMLRKRDLQFGEIERNYKMLSGIISIDFILLYLNLSNFNKKYAGKVFKNSI